MSELPLKEKAPCSVKQAVPDMVVCPACGYENEVWSDDEMPVCKECGKELKAG